MSLVGRSLLLTVTTALVGAGCAPGNAPGPAASPRSILLITIDTLRADHVTPAITPAIDRLARESLVFDQAITVAPLTLPAHASLLTALYPTRHGVRDNHIHTLAAGVPTFTDQLKSAGYVTGAFVSASVLNRRYGLARGFDVYDDDTGPLERSAGETLRTAAGWIASTRQPFFAWVHLFEPHAPYRAGTYAREVTTVDAALGGFVDRLRARADWADIVVGVTADHGESLGEHGEQTHGFFVYDATLRIPWVLRAPGLAPGHYPHQVRIVDILPTMIDVARAPVKGDGTTLDGLSLQPFIAGGASPALEAYSETFLPRYQFGWSALRSLRTGRAKYIAAPTEEAYDLIADASERDNVAGRRPDLVTSLSRQLAALERAAVAPARAAADPVVAEQLMSLGYLGYSPPSAADRGSGADPKEKIQVYRLAMDALEASEAGRSDEALSMLARARRLDDRVAQVHFIEGGVLGSRGRFDEAARALERAVALSPRHVIARFKLAQAYLQTGRDEAARRVLDSVLRDEPRNFRALHNLAAIAYRAGHLDRAEQLERDALAIDPEYAEAWNTIGAIHLLRRKPREAADALERATRFAPTNAQAFANLALARRGMGDMVAADAAARRACELEARFCR